MFFLQKIHWKSEYNQNYTHSYFGQFVSSIFPGSDENVCERERPLYACMQYVSCIRDCMQTKLLFPAFFLSVLLFLALSDNLKVNVATSSQVFAIYACMTYLHVPALYHAAFLVLYTGIVMLYILDPSVQATWNRLTRQKLPAAGTEFI